MKKIGLIILCFVLAHVSLFAQSEKVLWNGKKLKWKDFKGSVDTSVHNDAITFTTLEEKYSVNPQKQIHFTIAAWFFPRSWVKPGKESYRLLEHEQLHFTLVELYARKIRKYLSGRFFYNSTYKEELSFLFKRFWQELRNDQKRYDEETNHSGNKIKQEDWLNSVNREMAQLSKYTATTFVTKLK